MESMSSSGTAASSCSHLDWVLLNTTAVAGRHGNSTTARSSTRNGNTIEVSLCPKQAPHPSILFVNSSDMNLCVPPDIICTVDDLLLLSVNMGSGPFSLSPKDCDYFIYRAHTRCPLLHLLKRPHPYFNDIDVGLLPRSDGEYTVAALIPTTTADQYKLHLFHSKIQSWSCTTLSVNVPQTKFPVKIPRDSDRLLHHLTSTVITIGGKDGTMGWVDLWRGILFCNVLDDKPSLQCMPLPLPLKELSYNEGDGFPFGPAGQRRGIAFIRDKGCLKLVHMEISDVRLRRRDNETGAPSFRTDNWVLTTWSNTRMTNSYEDWHQDYMVQASNIQIDNPAISEVLESGFFMHKPLDGGAAGEQLALHNLSVSQPTPCLLGKDIVYLVARKKYMHPGAWILAVDMENGKLQAVAEFGSQRQLDSSIIYCPSRISKYINPVTTPVVGTAGEGHLMSWDEHINTSCSLDTVNCYGTRIKVIGNTGSNSTRQSVHATEQGFAVGMHAALHINPYYGKTSTAGLISHFEAVLPMGPTIIYNVPSRSGQDIPPQVIEALSGFPNMAGVKECVGHERVKCYTDKGITIWSGNDDECHDSRWKYGATGVISVTSNLVPGFMHSLMYEGENAILNEKLLPLMEWLFCQPNPIALNTALAQLGVARPVFRLPYVPLPLEKRVEFVRIVDAIGRENFVGQKEARVLDDDDFVLISRH